MMKKSPISLGLLSVVFALPAIGANVEGTVGDKASELSARMDSMPEVYGNVQIIYRNRDHEGFGGSDSQLTDFSYSTLGIHNSHEIMPGVEAFGRLELEGFFPTEGQYGDNKANDGIEVDEAYLGLRGNFGEVWIGSDDSQYEVLIGDYGNWYYEVAQANFYANFLTGEDDLIQYVSPNFSGLTLHAVVQVDGKAERTDGNSKYPFQLGAKYVMGDLTFAVAMDSNDAAANNENTYGARVDWVVNDNLSFNTFYSGQKGDQNIAIGYETGQTAAEFDPVDSFESFFTEADETGLGEQLVGVMGIYTLGANRFSLSYEMEEDDVKGADGAKRKSDAVTIQALHNVSDSMYVYVEGLRRTDEEGSTYDSDYNELSLGGVYLF